MDGGSLVLLMMEPAIIVLPIPASAFGCSISAAALPVVRVTVGDMIAAAYGSTVDAALILPCCYPTTVRGQVSDQDPVVLRLRRLAERSLPALPIMVDVSTARLILGLASGWSTSVAVRPAARVIAGDTTAAASGSIVAAAPIFVLEDKEGAAQGQNKLLPLSNGTALRRVHFR
jgi:hypothetical protein